MKTLNRKFGTLQFAVAIAFAIVLGLTMTQAVGAQKYAKGTNQAKSIENTKEMCEVGGGSFSVSDGPFEGVKYSKCSGGEMDGYTCAHGQTQVNCSYQIKPQTNGTIIVTNQLEVVTADPNIGSTSNLETNGQLVPLKPTTRAP